MHSIHALRIHVETEEHVTGLAASIIGALVRHHLLEIHVKRKEVNAVVP